MAGRSSGAKPARSATSLAELVRVWRQQALLSQEELAARSGLSVGTIRGIEAGRVRRPHGSSLRQMADALALNDAERQLIANAFGDATPG